MLCPRCQADLSDDAVICDTCNFIIDAQFLGENITNEKSAASDDAEPSAPPPSEQTRVRKIDVAQPAPVAVGAPAAATLQMRSVSTSAEPRGPRISLDKIAAPPPSVTEAVDDLSHQFQKLPLSERLTTICALIFIVSLGLPWRWSELDESVIGLFANGWPLGIVAVLVAVAPFARRAPNFRPYKKEIQLANLLAALIAAGGTGLYFQMSWKREVVYMAGKAPHFEWKMTPHVGLAIAVIAAVIMMFGALSTYLRSGKTAD